MKGRHDRASIVKGLIDYFVGNGLEIQYAGFSGYPKPFDINRHSPDVIAKDKKTGLVYIGQCKLCSELKEQITKEQFEDFPKMSMKSGNFAKEKIPFYIAVPTDCEAKIKETFRQFEIPWSDNIQVIGF